MLAGKSSNPQSPADTFQYHPGWSLPLQHWQGLLTKVFALPRMPENAPYNTAMSQSCHHVPNNSYECLAFFKWCHKTRGCTCHKH